MATKAVPKQVLLDGAQMSLAGFLAGTMGFLKEHDIPLKDWVAYVGDMFEGSLGEMEGEEPAFVLQHLLELEILPMGAEVISTNSTPDRAEVTITSLPSRAVLEKFGTTPSDLLKGSGITKREFESIFSMYEPAAKAIGLKFGHKSAGEQEILTLERPAKAARKK
jgi:hypothetical protein